MNRKLKIAFSGGGFRATFYALGGFRRLLELGLWKDVCRIDSVSGGSIAAGAIMAALAKEDFKDIADFDKRVTIPLKKLGQCRFREIITKPFFLIFLIFLACIYLYLNRVLNIHWLLSLILVALFFGISFVTIFRSIYSILFKFFLNLLFFKNKLMNSIPDYPAWSIDATCLNTGKRFRFKNKDFGGNKIGVTKDKNNIKISFAVACSAAFPQVFAPLKLDLKTKIRKFYDLWWTINPVLNANPPHAIFLSDGGVYDNLGSENILQGNDPFIILDAGGYIPQWATDTKAGWLKVNMRIIDTPLDQIVALRRRLLFNKTKQCCGTMLILGESVESYLDPAKFKDFGELSNNATPSSNMPNYQTFRDEIDKLTADLRTDLDGFHDIEIDMLMWAGAVRMDITIKRYLKNYLTTEQFNSIPVKPNFTDGQIKAILSKGGRMSGPLGFLHKSLRGV